MDGYSYILLENIYFSKCISFDSTGIEQGRRDIYIFIVKIYIKIRHKTPSACKASSDDLRFLKALSFYKEINKQISNKQQDDFIDICSILQKKSRL